MFSFFTGAGGNARLTAAMNATAESLPGRMVRVVLTHNLLSGMVLTKGVARDHY